ncbi:phosphatidate cytidylyltransferase [Candidatus Pelagibacter communis]|uniref:phosphatidate cytidylyltransferase n=1 Tax=Pelagibacter ubique TaxID=198252 RepID=UPI00094C0203|nr:phosphatidate cytidylyltransferase [Candidatus Pelagibacter ubique]
MKSEFLRRLFSSILLIPIIIFIIMKGSIYFNFFLIICFMLACFEWYKMSKKKLYQYIGILFLIFSFSSVFLLRNNLNDEYDFFLFVIFICISTDVGGYVIGKLFKGPKLTKLSPNKTYSGAIGSYLFSFLFLYVSVILNFFDFLNNNSLFNISLFILFISSISQIGDITVSYFKRKSKIKNSGKIIPGHGGILDRIDGMIFVFPFSYVIQILSIIKL